MFEAVGFITGFDDVALVRDTVEHGGRHLGIGGDSRFRAEIHMKRRGALLPPAPSPAHKPRALRYF